MIKVDKTLPVNPEGIADLIPLNRDEMWAGLMMKVEDARPFVPLMTKCETTQRLENGVVRDIIFDDMALRERIIFYPKEKIEFIRVGIGAEMGTIWNEILEDEHGKLQLRFAFELEIPNLSEAEEDAYRERRATGYLNAVQATLDHLRALKSEGRL